MNYDHKFVLVFHVKYPLFLSDFKELELSRHILQKKKKIQISRKSIQLELSCSLRTDRLTDTMKLIVAFSSFAEALKNYDVDKPPPPIQKRRIKETETKLKGLWS